MQNREPITDPWGERFPYGPGAGWPERVDLHLEDGTAAEDVEHWVRTASLLHSNGDAMDIAVRAGRMVGVRGRGQDIECGADGDLSGFRNWANENHVEELARHWNVDPARIPHDGPPTHAMKIFELAEQGDIRMLWISATNPAVSLPDLSRVRAILSRDELFLVVQDIFPTETTEFADVVLPAATWGEKAGCFTNASRVVHLSEKAVDPPGEAKPDLDIFLDFARRMDFRDLQGEPFPPWDDAVSAFDAWAASSAGRPCDHSGLSHAVLRESPSGIPWPCTAERPTGTIRLYTDGRFPGDPDYCETYGHDLVTGDLVDESAYRAFNPDGKAMIKAAPHLPAPEQISHDHPFLLLSGRTIHHFHTRTKTGRVPELRAAAPEMWVECSPADADRLHLEDGDLTEITTPRGVIRARCRRSPIREGTLFVPFHYGYWDRPGGAHDRAANELTATRWDPVSKQPAFKTVAAGLRRWGPGTRPA